MFIDSLSVGPALTTIFLGHDGDVAHLQLGDITNNAESLVATNGGASTGLQTINGSTHTGNQRIFIAGDGQDYDGTYTGGDGNDNTYIGDALADGVLGAFDGGGGTNTLFLIDHGSLDTSLSGAFGQITNYQAATFTGAFNEISRLDTGLLRGINVFNLNVATVAGGTLEIERLAANSTHTFNMGTTNANALDIDLDVGSNDVPVSDQDGDGSSDAVNLNFAGTANLTFNVTGDEIETLSVDFNDDAGAPAVTLNINPPVAPSTNDLKTLNLESATDLLDVNSGANPNLTLINSVHTGDPTDVIDLNGLQVSAAGAAFNGGYGVDLITGGVGNDTVNSGAGNDVVSGGNGNDLVNAGTGDDTVNGDAGNDTINGEAGQDVLSGGDNNDTINGGDDRDTIAGDAGDDVINGGDENPLNAGNAGDFILGDNNTAGVGGNDTINGNQGEDFIDGGAGNDVINGGEHDDLLFGGAGDDTIDGGTGTDEMWGGASGSDPLDGPVASESTVTVSGLVGLGDIFSLSVDTDGPGGVGATAIPSVVAVLGDDATSIAAKLAAALNATLSPADFNATSSGGVVTLEKLDGTTFSWGAVSATDGDPDEVVVPEQSTIVLGAGPYDAGDEVGFQIGASVIRAVVGADGWTAQQVYTALAADPDWAASGMTHSFNALTNTITLTGTNSLTDYPITSITAGEGNIGAGQTIYNIPDVDVAAVWTATPTGLDTPGESIEVTIGGVSYSQVFDTSTAITLGNFVASHGVAISAASGNGTLTATATQLVLTGPANGTAITTLPTSASIAGTGSVATATTPGVADSVTANAAPDLTDDNAPTTDDDNTQALTTSAVVNGVEDQTNGADRFVIDSPALTDAAADWVRDFNTLDGDTISFSGATIDGSATNYLNANGVFSLDALGFADLNTAIAYAQALYAGNPNLEYVSAWVNNGGAATYDANFDDIYLFADLNGDNLVSDIAKLTGTTVTSTIIDFNAIVS